MTPISNSSSRRQGACSLDAIIGTEEEQSLTRFIYNRRQNQRALGQKIARKRLLDSAQAKGTLANNGFLSHHRPGRGDLYSTGESSQYSNCSFLDGHDVILAASIHGDLDVIRLPRYSCTSKDNTMIEVAGKIKLSDANSSYSVSARYKLKSLQSGQAFAVGTPCGRLSIFSTEHASTWCRDSFPFDWKRPVKQESTIANAPVFITHQWQTNLLERQCFSNSATLNFLPSPGIHIVEPSNEPEWRIKPHMDALWDFRESPSSLLAAHAKQDFSGCASQVCVMDNRGSGRDDIVASIDLKRSGKNRSKKHGSPEGITAICFASESTLITAHANLTSAAKIENSIHLWDLRKYDQPACKSPIQNPSTTTQNSTNFQKHFISDLTPSSTKGRVMITSSSHQNRSIVQHFWYDLGRQSVSEKSPFIHQPHRGTIFATNPNQDFMACSDNVGGRDVVRLFDCNNSPEEPSNIRTKPSVKVIQRKRSILEQDPPYLNSHSKKISRSMEGTSVSSRSSSDEEDDDDSSTSDSEDDIASSLHQGVTVLGTFQPKLTDRYGLTTHLACLSVNDSGTALAGGSMDGDVFVWRGA